MQKCQAGDSTCYLAAKDGTQLNPPSPPLARTHSSGQETWATLHCADEVLNLHVTQAELQNTAACPSYQMTWNSARSSAVTAGSLTKREKLLPGCWTRASVRSLWNWHIHPPPPRCCSHPLHGTASKRLVFFQFCTLALSSTYVFFICIIKKRFQRVALQRKEK